MRSLWKSTVIGLIVLFLVLFWVFIIGISSNQPGSYFNKGHNAIWIGHKWVGDPSTDREVQNLVKDLAVHDIDTVFVHAGPLKSDGTIDPEIYKYSVDFLEDARKFDDNIQYQAWLGQIRSEIDLSDPVVRKNIAAQSEIMTEMVGFDGIHFDIEPVWDEDLDFIDVLRETREKIPPDKIISVALAEFIPGSFIWILKNVHEFKNYNSEVNFLNVAKYADQIAVMVYDTGIDKDWLYRWVVKEQTIRTTNLFDDTRVFIAIPSYEDEKEGFYPEAENVKNGLQGIVDGLNNMRSNEEVFAGVAIYPYWEMDDEEWLDYEIIWLK